MSAQILRPSKLGPRWRYRLLNGRVWRYWTAHDRPPQVWLEKRWQDVGLPDKATHAGPATLQ